jgi:hypothetical protein
VLNFLFSQDAGAQTAQDSVGFLREHAVAPCRFQITQLRLSLSLEDLGSGQEQELHSVFACDQACTWFGSDFPGPDWDPFDLVRIRIQSGENLRLSICGKNAISLSDHQDEQLTKTQYPPGHRTPLLKTKEKSTNHRTVTVWWNLFFSWGS